MSRRGNDSPFDSDRRPGAADERIADWVDGRLDAIQLQRFEAELRVNPALRAAAEEYRRSVQAIREALAGGERVRAGFADRVMTAIEGERRQRGRRWIPWLGSAAAAAALVGLWLALSRGVILPDSRRELARAPSASPSADGAPALREAPAERLDEGAGAPTGGGLEILPEIFQRELTERGLGAGLDSGSAARDGETGAETSDAEDERKGERAERASLGGEPRARSVVPKPEESVEESRTAPGSPASDPQRGFRDESAGENQDERRQAESPAPSSAAALDAGQLVYLVEIPADALDRLHRPGADATPTFGRIEEREPAGELPGAAATQILATTQALAAYRLAIEPLQAPGTWTGNVTTPRLFALDLTQEAAETKAAQAKDSGRYSFMPGDLVFEIDGDEAQVQDYLRHLAKPLRDVAGSIAVQRAVDLVARERIAVPTDPAQQSAADELFLGFFTRTAFVEESLSEAARRGADRDQLPAARTGRGATPKAAGTGPSSPGPSSPGPGGPATPPPEPVAPSTAVQPTGGARAQNSWVVLRAKPSAPESEAGPAQRR
ncbi:MAG: hypothetical protein IT457_17965 [Planctomycetes bacterium]|nr:hypothetical protein [Planctomycetota bacterium]